MKIIVNKTYMSLFILLATVSFLSCKGVSVSYLDQAPPSTTPELFAPNIINTDSIELNVVFNSDHTELFFSRIIDNSFIIHHSELKNGQWTAIKPIQLFDNVLVSIACDPTISKDGKTMYFLGVDPGLYKMDITPEELYKIPPDIYQSKKVNGKWQLATKVVFSISTEFFETYPVVTSDGSLYFKSNRPSAKGGMNTYRSQFLGSDKFDTPKLIDFKTNNKELITYVSPNELYAITNGQGKFQISFNINGRWTNPIEIPLTYEPQWRYYAPYMTSDGKYFIFSRRYNKPNTKGWTGVEKGEVYWVNADILFKAKVE